MGSRWSFCCGSGSGSGSGSALSWSVLPVLAALPGGGLPPRSVYPAPPFRWSSACPLVGVVGSRSIPVGFAPLVDGVCRSLSAGGRRVVTGCARGVDALARTAAVDPLVFRVGPSSVGGPPLRARLALRTRALVAAVTARSAAASGCALVVFFASSSSRGSLLAARCAAAAGLPVLAFACGFPAARLPLLSPAGSWRLVSIATGPWVGAWRWVPGSPPCQLPLFPDLPPAIA